MITYRNLWLVPVIAALACTALFGMTPAVAEAKTICVDSDAPNTPGSGTCWSDPYKSLQSALGTAAAGDEIWVAEGIYTPGISIGDTFTVSSGVSLYGGFAATETLRSQRNWLANVTVLSGDIDQNDITDANGVVTTTANIVGDNALHVVWMDGVAAPIDGATQLDGFTITAGHASSVYSQGYGGGLYCHGAGNGATCSPTIANVIFTGNTADPGAGGGMYNDGANSGASNPALANVIFRGNTALYGGGAMFNDGSNSGASSPTLVNVTFRDNSAELNGGGAMHNAGRDNGTSSPTLTNVTFSGNKTTNRGGAMVNVSNGSGAASPTLTNVIFRGNSATFDGGAMYNSATLGMFDQVGGTSNPVLVNVIFSSNTSESSDGGAISNYAYAPSTCNPVLTNVTFSGNTAVGGGAMFSQGVSTPSLTNVILWGNTAMSGIQASGALTINYSLVQGGADGIGGSNAFSAGMGNIASNPLFADGAAGDLRLLPGSPAIDAGTNNGAPTTDMRSLPRPVNSITDMGAYEAQGFTLAIMSGDGQTTTAASAFALPLQVRVSGAEPVGPGGAITFTPPASGPGLSVTTPFTGITDLSGAVTVPVTANANAGAFSVVVTARGAAAPIVFRLTSGYDYWLHLPLMRK